MRDRNASAIVDLSSFQEERARMLLDHIEDYALFMLDPSGVVKTWNTGAERLNGYTPAEIVGRHFSLFYPPADIAAGKCERKLRCAATEGRFEEEGWRIRKNGEPYWASAILTAIRDASGSLVGFAKVTRDLTARRKAEEQLRQSEERFRLLVSSIQDYAVFMLEPDGRVSSWNTGAQQLKGYQAQEIIGHPLTRFYQEEDVARGKPWALLREATAHGRVEDEGWRVRKDGTCFWANVIITAMRDEHGTLLGFSKVTRDLTPHKRMEQERLQLAQSEEAIRLRDEFLSIAAHELKTPLTALHLQLQGLRKQVEALDQKIALKLGLALRSTGRLSGLVETLLDVSRISTGRLTLHPERFELTAAVRELAERLREAASTAQCQLLLREEGPIEGTWDRLRIEQVVTNLLANAFKYAADCQVEIAMAREGAEAILIITDTGPGLPAQDIPRLFNRFERAVPMSHYGGLGLGLYVCREIVTAHGGTISAANAPGGGARFTIRLPTERRGPGDAGQALN
ncbi:sensor histidine kinase [Stigmatella erecta]|uniref:histidine kinase n=1 Tax=Stigmatella erecta TaxID=83460 RepID=A0A1I0KI48_9BACT|nr:PAS domain-containing sensor histidine kinase [Stigmatella erecta]SEU24486.1 PAS/PAC sensor hybrid histidine kinase [Stigmatella erecta]